ncbi:MAG: hypothetical protein VZR73_09435, partial [Acutalibacteraceae bacterium]|nr:hypothetical protein [Clostridia bacterium]MEE3404293.1 hypothetical protein [Acutalibacteraceae bacterium]
WLIFATSPKGEAFETFPASPSGEVPSVSEAEGFLFLCNFQICSFIGTIHEFIGDSYILSKYKGVYGL